MDSDMALHNQDPIYAYDFSSLNLPILLLCCGTVAIPTLTSRSYDENQKLDVKVFPAILLRLDIRFLPNVCEFQNKLG